MGRASTQRGIDAYATSNPKRAMFDIKGKTEETLISVPWATK